MLSAALREDVPVRERPIPSTRRGVEGTGLEGALPILRDQRGVVADL